MDDCRWTWKRRLLLKIHLLWEFGFKVDILRFFESLKTKILLNLEEIKNGKGIDFGCSPQFNFYEYVKEEDESLQPNFYYSPFTIEENTFVFTKVTKNVIAEEISEQLEPTATRKLSTLTWHC